jgi:hypothetical protein
MDSTYSKMWKKAIGNFSILEFEQRINEELPNQQKIQNNMKYKIFNVKDLLSEIQYEGVRKGTKTEAYLENVIETINKTGKYVWIQFFQLVDVFYVAVQVLPTTVKNAQDEIRDHYANADVRETQPQTIKGTLSGDKTLKSADPVSLKTSFPWKQ